VNEFELRRERIIETVLDRFVATNIGNRELEQNYEMILELVTDAVDDSYDQEYDDGLWVWSALQQL